MNASFGIDHPLIATHDIEGLRSRLITLGFNMTTTGKHPWGTSTSLGMFDDCLLEIMGIYDSTLIDEVPAGNFLFGRHVYEHLQKREGIALTALHSTNSVADATKAQSVGMSVAGHLEFGRDVTLPDGQVGRTKTTLALLPNPAFPRLSFFLCQQHRPELIYVPQWLQHPNTVKRISGITIYAEQQEHAALQKQFSGLYSEVVLGDDGFHVQTANGSMHIKTRVAIENEFGLLPNTITAEDGPCIIAMDFQYRSRTAFKSYISKSGFEFKSGSEQGVTEDVFQLIEPTMFGNTFFRFSQG